MDAISDRLVQNDGAIVSKQNLHSTIIPNIILEPKTLEPTPREEFPTKGLEGAPSNDIGWHFGTPMPNGKGNIVCKLCGKVVKGGITRFKEHIAHKTGNVAPCPNVTGVIRESMMNVLKESNTKKIDKKRRKYDFLSQLREEEDEHEEFIDEISAIRQATRESIQLQHEWHRREEFRRSTGGWDNIYEKRRSSQGSSIPIESEFTLRGAIPELVRSEAASKFLIYERLPFQLASSPWLYNLIQVSTEVRQGVKLPTPYEVSDVYLESEYQRVPNWVNGLKTHWKELGATLMCDGWTNSLNQMHIINFLFYCSKGTIFWKSIYVSNVRSRDAQFYYSLLDSVVEEIGENYIVQIVTDNEAAMKTAGTKLMLKRKHLYWTSCTAHCLDLYLEDIGKRPSVTKVLNEAKKVTCFIYNHIWTVDLMKKYTQGKQILRPALTRFATHFIQLDKITRQKQGLREMFSSNEYKESKWGQQKSGPTYEAKKIILGKDFWKKANDLIKVYEPLVKVLILVDSDEKPTIGFIYEAVDRAKRAIQQDCRYFTEYKKIIDKRWNFMHFDLHSAGYFLNPQFQFGVEHSQNVLIETLEGIRSVIERLEPSLDTQVRMVNQLLLFRDKHETFGTLQAQRAWKQMNLAEWWIIYGTCVPELQKLAIKVLSQTTSASNCERNWSTFSYIHTKARNRLKYKKLEKLVFTYYNMRLQIRHQKRMSTDDINTSFNPISLDYIFEDVDPLSKWLHEKENSLLDGENAGMLPVDTSDDEMDVNQSQQPNLSHSSSSSTPSQSGDGPDGGGLSPVDEDDGYSSDRGEIRSSSQYGREYGVGTTSGHFRDRSEFDGNMFPEPRRDRSEPRAPTKGKGKKHTSIGSSSGRRSSSSNLGYSDSSTSTQGFYPPEQPSYFQPSHGYPQPYGYYPPFPNYGVLYQPQMHPPPPMYHPPPPLMYPPPQIYPPHQLYENQCENFTFFGYIFGQRLRESSQERFQSKGEGSDLPRHSTNW
ncbi:hypothetical protein PVK06_042862 [Gossypium arboreum]|uniref:BED-type domain-containing protein n=1 Tax=Gossypium arboreum TaxID=29729 RepID=A0ABR0MLW5_GOSAR|nr:hypothetical protein PVK06_042862 [Gossypium arboreum]